MDTPSKIIASTTNSTAKVINNIHSMPWLKQDLSSQNGKMQPSVGKDGQILSAKKTNEHYFPGTKEGKKGKKIKEKKGKSMVSICNLKDLINVTQRCDKTVIPVKDVEEITEYIPSRRQKEPQPASYVNQTIATDSVWCATSSTADKLFPNVQSVVINRMDEEEMFTRAIAESIATIQLEQFNKLSPIKEDHRESLYEDDVDEGGWDNIKRNLPPPETMESGKENNVSGQRKSYDDNNNSSNTGGILRNKQENSNQYSLETEDLDFSFKRLSKDKKTTAPSLKTVSFNESISAMVRSSELSEIDERENTLCSNKKEFVIDKYGRVDGYSERRLFMGKGARLREIEFIQKQCNLEADKRCQKFQSIPQVPTPDEIQTSMATTSQCSENLQSKIPIPNSEKPKTERKITKKNFQKPPEIRQEKYKSDSKAVIVKTTSQCPKYIQSQGSISNPKSPKPKEADAVKNTNRTPKIQKSTEQIAHHAKKITESLSESLSASHDSTSKSARKSCNENLSSVELKLENLEETEMKPPKSRAQTMKETENIETPHDTMSSTSDGRQMKPKQISQRERKSSYNENPKKEIIHLSQREKIPDKKAKEDLQENISIPEDAMSKDLAVVLKRVNNVLETESESNGRCLVPTLVRDDEYTPHFPPINFEYAHSTADMLKSEFQSPAYQNLLLAGVSCVDSSSDTQCLNALGLESKNLQFQNYSIENSVSLNSLSLQSESFNNEQHIHFSHINGGEQIYQNTSINQETNLNANTISVLPEYVNVAKNLQINQTDYANFLRHSGLQNLPYQSMGCSMNSDNLNLPSFTESRKNIFSGNNIEDSLLSYERTQDDGKRFSAQAPPGLVKNVQLPPGFTRRQSVQIDDTDEANRAIDPLTITESMKDVKSNQRKQHKKKSQLGSSNNCGGTIRNFARSESTCGGRKPTPASGQTNRTSSKSCRNHYGFQNSYVRQKSNGTENRKVPYPILGASRSSYEECGNSENDVSRSTQSPTLRRDAIIIRSSSLSPSVLSIVNDNMREVETEASSSNNNYFPSGTQSTILNFDPQGINSPTNIPQSVLPINYRIPDHNMANWQYNVNLNSPQVPVGLTHNCKIPVTNPDNFIVNTSVDYFKAPIYQNLGCQQLPMHMLNQAQIPVFNVPHDFNTEGNDYPLNAKLENMESFQLNCVSNHDYSIETQRSMIGAPSCGSYNLNERPMSQFISNSNFYEIETMPNTQESWSMRNKQSNDTAGQIPNYIQTGRGRGRKIKKSLS